LRLGAWAPGLIAHMSATTLPPAMPWKTERDRRPKMDFILCLAKKGKTSLHCRLYITGTMALAL
jgi:hypothetical protein